jgi:hypothetical protein
MGLCRCRSAYAGYVQPTTVMVEKWHGHGRVFEQQSRLRAAPARGWFIEPCEGPLMGTRGQRRPFDQQHHTSPSRVSSRLCGGSDHSPGRPQRQYKMRLEQGHGRILHPAFREAPSAPSGTQAVSPWPPEMWGQNRNRSGRPKRSERFPTELDWPLVWRHASE